MSKQIIWKRDEYGVYTSDCGRFTIKRPQFCRNEWVLIDKERRDVCIPHYLWMHTYYSLAFAKNNAQRIADTGRPIGA